MKKILENIYPTVAQGENKVAWYLVNEKMAAQITDRQQQFRRVWSGLSGLLPSSRLWWLSLDHIGRMQSEWSEGHCIPSILPTFSFLPSSLFPPPLLSLSLSFNVSVGIPLPPAMRPHHWAWLWSFNVGISLLARFLLSHNWVLVGRRGGWDSQGRPII